MQCCLLVLLYMYWLAMALARHIVSAIDRCQGLFPRSARAERPNMWDAATYRLFVVRSATVTDPAELVVPLCRILGACCNEDWRVFQLHWFSPTLHRPTRVYSAQSVRDMLADSQIGSPGDRLPHNPTHRVGMFTVDTGPSGVELSLEFVTTGQPALCPGLKLELRLTPSAAGETEPFRDARLNRMLGPIADILQADHSAIVRPDEIAPEWWWKCETS